MKEYLRPRDAVRLGLTCWRFRRLLPPKGLLLDHLCIGNGWDTDITGEDWGCSTCGAIRHVFDMCPLKVKPCKLCTTPMPRALRIGQTCCICGIPAARLMEGCTRCGFRCKNLHPCLSCGMTPDCRNTFQIEHTDNYKTKKYWCRRQGNELIGVAEQCLHVTRKWLIVESPIDIPPFRHTDYAGVRMIVYGKGYVELMSRSASGERVHLWNIMYHKQIPYCSWCFTTKGKLKWCGACQSVSYCSRECQVSDWPNHKKEHK